MLALKTESRVAGEHGVLHEKNLEEQEAGLILCVLLVKIFIYL